MKAGQIGGLGKYRFWGRPGDVQELCSELLDSCSWLDSDFEKICALEVFVPKGARCEYGLLGVGYRKSVSSEGFSGPNINRLSGGGDYKNSLLGNIEKTNASVPEGYMAASISGAISESLKNPKIELGKIEILFGAYGKASSSEKVFEALGRSLARIVSLSSNESIDSCIKGAFHFRSL